MRTTPSAVDYLVNNLHLALLLLFDLLTVTQLCCRDSEREMKTQTLCLFYKCREGKASVISEHT